MCSEAKTMTSIETVAIVGARGQMGQLFVSRCQEAGQSVAQINRPFTDQDLEQGLKDADMIYMSVPASAFTQVLEHILPFIPEGCILSDNVSVKVSPLTSMLQLYNGPVVATHPLFGPEPTPEDLRVAVAPGRDDQALVAVIHWLERIGFEPFLTTAEEHDRAMAQIQALNFTTTVAYLAALSRQDNIRQFLTPSFRRRLKAAEKMLREDAELFSTLFEANPFSQEAVRRFRNYLQVAAGGDVDILVERGRWWWESQDQDSK